jgi:hypothetical protein
MHLYSALLMKLSELVLSAYAHDFALDTLHNNGLNQVMHSSKLPAFKATSYQGHCMLQVISYM